MLGLQDILGEYVARGDGERARRKLLELGVPAYHHELISLVFATASTNLASGPRLIALLDLLACTGTVSQVACIPILFCYQSLFHWSAACLHVTQLGYAKSSQG